MILVFILLGIIILVLTFGFMLLVSTIKIEIKNFEASNINNKNTKKQSNYSIVLSFYLCNKIKWISFNLNNEKMKKRYSKIQLEKIDLKEIKKDFQLQYLKKIKKMKISYLDLKIQLGTQNPILTAFLISIFSAAISISLPYISTNLNSKNYKYTVQPIYQNQNLYKIQLNCIIELKMVHIINVIYIFLKKGRSDLNERTTSNRRTYGYSYE